MLCKETLPHLHHLLVLLQLLLLEGAHDAGEAGGRLLGRRMLLQADVLLHLHLHVRRRRGLLLLLQVHGGQRAGAAAALLREERVRVDAHGARCRQRCGRLLAQRGLLALPDDALQQHLPHVFLRNTMSFRLRRLRFL